MIAEYVTDSPQALAAIAAPGNKNIWINGSQTFVYTGEHYVVPQAPSNIP